MQLYTPRFLSLLSFVTAQPAFPELSAGFSATIRSVNRGAAGLQRPRKPLGDSLQPSSLFLGAFSALANAERSPAGPSYAYSAKKKLSFWSELAVPRHRSARSCTWCMPRLSEVQRKRRFKRK